MADVCPAGPAGLLCHAEHAAGSAAGNVIGAASGSVLNSLANDMVSGANALVKTLSTFWMNVNTPQLSGAGTPVSLIQGDTSWIVTSAAVVCILVAAGQMALRRRGQPAAVMMLGLTRLVVVSAAGTFVVEALGKLGDTFSADLIRAAHVGTQGWAGMIDTAAIGGAFAGSSPGAIPGARSYDRLGRGFLR